MRLARLMLMALVFVGAACDPDLEPDPGTSEERQIDGYGSSGCSSDGYGGTCSSDGYGGTSCRKAGATCSSTKKCCSGYSCVSYSGKAAVCARKCSSSSACSSGCCHETAHVCAPATYCY